MTATVSAPVVTIEHVLFGVPRPDVTIGESLRGHGISRAIRHRLGMLSPDQLGVVEELAATIVAQLCARDLGGLLLAGWHTYAKLLDAARATATDPNCYQIVALATHTVTWSQRPYLHIEFDGVPGPRLVLDLCVKFQLTSVAAVVHMGSLVGLRSGRCDLTASLKVEGAMLVERRTSIDPALLVDLGEGIPLILPRY
jgi:hypothetical protein